jgi:hypothetical protein
MAGIELTSPSFVDHQPIPARHAKDHDNLSPALEWSGVPQEAVELAVLCEDPDAPRGTFTHWVLAGLQPTATGLAEGEHPAAAVEGRNDSARTATTVRCRQLVTVRTGTSSGCSPPRRRLAWSPGRRPMTCVARWRAGSWPAAPWSVPTSADPTPVNSRQLHCWDLERSRREARIDELEKGGVMAGQITLTEQEARALSSLLDRASDRLATYEEQTHQDRRLAEEIREAAGDLVGRISREGSTA